MKIVMGPIALARPGWGLEKGTVATVVSSDGKGRPEVLAAQVLCGAALQGARVLMLLPQARETDITWQAMMAMLADGTSKSAAEAMAFLPIKMHAWGTGWERTGHADLVYASALTVQELRRLSRQTDAPILVVGSELDYRSPKHRTEVIRVGADTLLIDSEGIEIPVVYDPSGPIYRAA